MTTRSTGGPPFATRQGSRSCRSGGCRGWQCTARRATIAFLLLVVAELAVPVWAERGLMTTWHPHHIAERYGLFTIIVLGECVLGATVAARAAVTEAGWSADLLLLG